MHGSRGAGDAPFELRPVGHRLGRLRKLVSECLGDFDQCRLQLRRLCFDRTKWGGRKQFWLQSGATQGQLAGENRARAGRRRSIVSARQADVGLR